MIAEKSLEMNTDNPNSPTSISVNRQVFAWIKLRAYEQNLSVNGFLKQELDIPPDWMPDEKALLETRKIQRNPYNVNYASLIQPAILTALQQSGGSQTAKAITKTVIATLKDHFGTEWQETYKHSNSTRLEKLVSFHFGKLLKAGEVVRPVCGLWQLNKKQT